MSWQQEKGDYENYKVPPGARKQKDDEDDCEELNYSTIVIPARVNKWESESDEEDEEEERTQYTHLKLWREIRYEQGWAKNSSISWIEWDSYFYIPVTACIIVPCYIF